MCRKRHPGSSISPQRESSVSRFNKSRLLYDGSNIHSPTNAALILENIKQETEGLDVPIRMPSASRRRSAMDNLGVLGSDGGIDSIHQLGSPLKSFKIEDDLTVDSEEKTFALFESLLDSALQGA